MRVGMTIVAYRENYVAATNVVLMIETVVMRIAAHLINLLVVAVMEDMVYAVIIHLNVVIISIVAKREKSVAAMEIA